MTLVDTSIIVAWLDPTHPDHSACSHALDVRAGSGDLALSSVTFAELAAGGGNRDALVEDLGELQRIDFGVDGVFRAGQAFARYRSDRRGVSWVFADFFIRGLA